MNRVVAIALVLVAPLQAWAGIEWAMWSGFPGSTRTGTFSGGIAAAVTLTPASFVGDGSVPAESSFTSTPAVPGMTTTGNPPYQQFLSGPAPATLVSPGDLVVEIDLSGLPIGTRPLFGIADQKFTYQFELRDDADALLSLAGITVTPYNIFYTPGPGFPEGLVADQNSLLIDGKLFRDFTNDAVPTNFYNHTGLTILSDLPVETRVIRLRGGQTSESEGLSVFIGMETSATIGVTDTSGSPTDKSISFGSITVGATSVTRTVTATNPGDAAVQLVVTSTGLDPGEFDLGDNCSGTLEASADCEVTMAFHPTTDGPATGSLDLEVDGGTVVSVTVTGTGTLEKTGDANGDGKTTAADALHVLRIAVASLVATPGIFASSDLNGDGKLTVVDALAVLRKSIGL